MCGSQGSRRGTRNSMTARLALETLLQQLSDDALTDAQFDALAQMLERDETARREYLLWRDQEAQLYWDYSGVTTVAAGEDLPAPIDSGSGAAGRRPDWAGAPAVVRALVDHVRRSPASLSLSVAVATLAALLLIMAMVPVATEWNRPAADPQELPRREVYVARFVRSVDARWTTAEAFAALVRARRNGAAGSDASRLTGEHRGDAGPALLRQGTRLRAGQTLYLAAGVAEIAFAEGASVILEAPAMFVVQQRDRGKLVVGRLVATCSTLRSQGFEIITPLGKLVDLGTEFAVAVRPDGHTQVAVLEGLVAFHAQRASAPQSTSLIHAGETVSWKPNGAREASPAIAATPPTAFVRRQGGRWTGLKNIVADYRQDFKFGVQGSPTLSGRWRYLWNQHGPIGSAKHYADLVWNEKGVYASDAIEYPAPPPARFARLGRKTGHPGLGAQQPGSGGIDRFVIAAYTVESSGRYSLVNASVRREPKESNQHRALRALVFVDYQAPVFDATIPPATKRSLDDLRRGWAGRRCRQRYVLHQLQYHPQRFHSLSEPYDSKWF